MSVLSAREIDLLEEIDHSNVVSDQHTLLADRLESVGIIRQGFDTSTGEFVNTAHLTPFGKELLRIDRIYRSWWRRLLYNWFSPIICQ